MNRPDERHLNRAIQVALSSTCRTQHGVVIAHGPKVLAVAVNTARNHPDVCSDPKTQAARHAEVNALRQLGRTVDHSRLTLYSARVLKDGTPTLAKPCTRCQAVLDYVEIGGVYWTL